VTVEPITRVTLRDEASRRLRSDIASGLLEPATLYPIAEVASRLGVSITPVREALLELANDGLVEIVRNRGFRVREVTDRDLDEIVEVRLLLEVAAVRRLAGALDPADLARLREAAKETVEAARKGDLSSYLELDKQLHLDLLGLAGNARLVSVVSRLRDETRLYGLGRLAGTQALVETTKDHTRLLDALEAGDADRAEELLRAHLGHIRGVWSGRG
jgi:DNA-binding GntR family transcriptional regulator